MCNFEDNLLCSLANLLSQENLTDIQKVMMVNVMEYIFYVRLVRFSRSDYTRLPRNCAKKLDQSSTPEAKLKLPTSLQFWV